MHDACLHSDDSTQTDDLRNRRRSARWSAFVALTALLLILPTSITLRAQDDDSTADAEQVSGKTVESGLAESLDESQKADLELWKAGVTESTNQVARRTASIKLIESGWPEAISFLTDLLEQSPNVEAVRSIADAIIEVDAAPVPLLNPLVRAYVRVSPNQRDLIGLAVTTFDSSSAIRSIADDIGDETRPIEERVALIELLARFVDVETVDSLIPLLDDSQSEVIRRTAQNALETVTGFEMNGASRLRWQNWWDRRRDAGREGLLEATLQRVRQDLRETNRREREVLEERQLLMTSLIRWIERAHALTPQDRRPAMIVSLLDDPRPEIRSLGLRLVERMMSNAEPITPEVGDAVAKRFDDPVPANRAEAIRRLVFIDAARASTLVVERLPEESNEEVRAAAYSALAREPVAEAVPILIERFVNSPGRPSLPTVARRPIVEALLAALHHDMISDQAVRNDLARAAIGDLAQSNDPQAVLGHFIPLEFQLLAWSNEVQALDLARLVLTLSDDQTPQGLENVARGARLAAANGLAASGQNDELLWSAADDPAIHPIALGALISRRGPLFALERVLTDFPNPDRNTRMSDLDRIMSRLPMPAWIKADDLLAASDQVSIDRRADWLRRALNTNGHNGHETNGNGNGNGRNGEPNATVTTTGTTTQEGMLKRAICMRLAQLELQRGEPDLALDAIRSAPVAENEDGQYARLRTVTLIATGQFDTLPDSTRLQLPIWFEALDVLEMRLSDHEDSPDQRQETLSLQVRIAQRIRSLANDSLTDLQRKRLAGILERPTPGNSPSEPTNQPGGTETDLTSGEGANDGDGPSNSSGGG